MQERLELTAEGTVLLHLHRTWADGPRIIRFEPTELLEKLASMIPKQRINLLVRHGVFAPHARHRPEAVRQDDRLRAASSNDRLAPRTHSGLLGAPRRLTDGLSAPYTVAGRIQVAG